MFFNSAPSDERESVCSGDHLSHRNAGADTARQPASQAAKKRLARGYIPALCAGVSIPPLVFIASVFPLGWEGVIAVTGWSTLAVVYIAHVLIRMRDDLHRGYRKWDRMRKNALNLELVYEAVVNDNQHLESLNNIYRAQLDPMFRIRRGGAAAGSTSERNGSAVVEFPNPKGVA